MKCELISDLISQNILLAEINTVRKKQTFDLSKTKSECDAMEQNKITTDLREDKKAQLVVKKQTKHSKKYFVILSTLAVSSLIVLSLASNLFANSSSNTPLQTHYLIQNLRGDTAETWVSWNLTPNKSLTFTILGESLVSPEKISEIKNVILSEKSLQIDNSLLHKGLKGTSSTYYVGWAGAMKQASQNPTKMVVPQNFEYVSSEKGAADITIKLVSQRSGDGYSGYTQSTVDKNQILKSTISIYNVEELSTSQITTIVRHEFGHAIGLAHTTATEELMAPTITTDYPYISPCTVHAIEKLYDGNQKSEVVCEI
jgi:predicted Zn-dependent protease